MKRECPLERRLLRGSLAAVALFIGGARTAHPQTAAERRDAALVWLAAEMDRFHLRSDVYIDYGSPGNRFNVPALFEDPAAPGALALDMASTVAPHSGTTCIRSQFTNVNGTNYAGWYLMNGVLSGSETIPSANWGTFANAGVDLTGAKELRFFAKGPAVVEFFAFGVGWNPVTIKPTEAYPDGSPRIPTLGTKTVLSDQWTELHIDVSGAPNLAYVLGGFGFALNAIDNPTGATVSIDDITYDVPRLDDPRLIRSFVTLEQTDFDRVMRTAAFVYDNALAVLAFLARDAADDRRRAELLCDAFVYALDHDRAYDDGGLRNAYQPGSLTQPPGWTPNGRASTARLPVLLTPSGTAQEDKYQVSRYIGPNSFAALALLSLYERDGRAAYLDAAVRLGNWIATHRFDGAGAGFRGGRESAGTDPETETLLPWSSGEQNLVARVVFARLAAATGDEAWTERAEHASAMIDRLFVNRFGLYVGGTTDGAKINYDLIPLDVQAYDLLSRPSERLDLPGFVDRIPTKLEVSDCGFTGIDSGVLTYGKDRPDAVSFEATAVMALALRSLCLDEDASRYLAELDRAIDTAAHSDGAGLVASPRDGTTTPAVPGDPPVHSDRLHVGATAWYALAQSAFNPLAAPVVPPARVTSVADLPASRWALEGRLSASVRAVGKVSLAQAATATFSSVVACSSEQAVTLTLPLDTVHSVEGTWHPGRGRRPSRFTVALSAKDMASAMEGAYLESGASLTVDPARLSVRPAAVSLNARRQVLALRIAVRGVALAAGVGPVRRLSATLTLSGGRTGN